MMKNPKKKMVFALIFLLTTSACFHADEKIEITEVRDAVSQQIPELPVLDTATRMGLTHQNEANPASASVSHSAPSFEETLSVDIISDMLIWQPPEHWQEAAERPMRLATYVPTNTTATECTVTFLPGEAGGIAANINRWRAQLGHAALTDDEIAALPRRDILNEQSVYISCSDEKNEMMLLGMICPVPGGLLFLKMSGPISEVRAEEEHFNEFCLSMRFRD